MTQRYTGLQILRFVAAMLVVVMHITQAISIHITGRGGAHYWTNGSAGVDIFFVISGLVMALSTRALPNQGRARLQAAWIFVKRRILRIVPLYWFYTLLKAALLMAVPALAIKSSIEPGHLAASLFFIPAASPWGTVQPVLPVGWTLNFEMLFYAVFAIAIALGARRLRFCVLFFLAVFLAGRLDPHSTVLGFYAQSIIFEFILGVAIGYALTRWGPASALTATLAVAVGLLLIFAAGGDHAGERLYPWGIGAAVLVLGTVWLEPWIAKLPGAAPLSFLGDASYSIYLSHTFVVPAGVVALRKIGLNDPFAVLSIVSALVLIVGSLSHVWLEKPMTSLFKRLLFPSRPPQYQNAANTPAY